MVFVCNIVECQRKRERELFFDKKANSDSETPLPQTSKYVHVNARGLSE